MTADREAVAIGLEPVPQPRLGHPLAVLDLVDQAHDVAAQIGVDAADVVGDDRSEQQPAEAGRRLGDAEDGRKLGDAADGRKLGDAEDGRRLGDAADERKLGDAEAGRRLGDLDVGPRCEHVSFDGVPNGILLYDVSPGTVELNPRNPYFSEVRPSPDGALIVLR